MGVSPATKVGFVTVLAAGVFGATAVWLTRSQLKPTGYPLTLLYQDVNGLAPGAHVMLMGVRVGRVVAIDAGEDHVRVRCLIEDAKTRIRTGSKFKIYSKGLIGDKALEIFPPEKRTGLKIASGAVIRGDDPVRLDATFEAADQAVKAIRRYVEAPQTQKTFQTGLGAVRETFGKVDKLTTHLDQLVLEAGAFVRHGRGLATSVTDGDVRVMVRDLKFLTSGMRQTYQALLGSPESRNAAQEAIDNLARLSGRLSAVAGQIESFTSDPKLKSDLAEIVRQSQQLLASLRGPEGRNVPGLSPRLALMGLNRKEGRNPETNTISGTLGMRVDIAESAIAVGVEEIGLDSRFTATWGLPRFFSPTLGFHVGMVRSGLGAGIDWAPLGGLELGAEAFLDRETPKARLSATLFPDFLARRFGLNIEYIQSQAPQGSDAHFSSTRAGIQWRPLD